MSNERLLDACGSKERGPQGHRDSSLACERRNNNPQVRALSWTVRLSGVSVQFGKALDEALEYSPCSRRRLARSVQVFKIAGAEPQQALVTPPRMEA